MTTVNLDHYVGRKVEDVNKRAGEWQLVLAGGARIVNYDENYEMPEKDVLVGLVFQRVDMDKSQTILVLGTDDNPATTHIHLAPIHYGVADSNRFEGVVRPQEGAYIHDPAEDQPEEPSERLAEVAPEDAESASNESDG